MNHSNERLEFACPHCQSRLDAARSLAGQRIQCSHCHKRLKVPGSVTKPSTSRASDYAYRQVKQKSDPVNEPGQLRETPLLPDTPVAETKPSASPKTKPSDTKPSDTKPSDSKPSDSKPDASASPTTGTQRRTPAQEPTHKSGATHETSLDDVELEPLLPASDEAANQDGFGLQDLDQPVDLFEGLPDRPTRTRAQLEAEAARDEKARRAAQPHDPNEMFAVRCPLCDSVLMARYRQIGSMLRCSDCHTNVRVSAPSESRERRSRLGPRLAGDVSTAVTTEQVEPSEDEYRLAEEPQLESSPTSPSSRHRYSNPDVDAFLSGDDVEDGPATELENDYSLQPIEEEEPAFPRGAEPLVDPTIPSDRKSVAPTFVNAPPVDDELVIREEPADQAKSLPQKNVIASHGGSHGAFGGHMAEGQATGPQASAWTQPHLANAFQPGDYGSEGRTISNRGELLPEESDQRAPLDELTFSILVQEVRAIVTAPSILLAFFFVTLTLMVETSLLTWFEHSAREMLQAEGDLLAQRVAGIKWYVAMGAAGFVGCVCLVQLSVFGARLIQATAGREQSPDITSEIGPFEVFNDAVLFCVPLIVALVPAAFLSGIVSLLTHSVLASRLVGLVIFMIFPPLIMSVMKSDKFYGVVDSELFQSLGTETSVWRSLWSITGCIIAVLAVCLFLLGFHSYGLDILVSPVISISFFAYFAAIGVTAHVLGNHLMGQPHQPTS